MGHFTSKINLSIFEAVEATSSWSVEVSLLTTSNDINPNSRLISTFGDQVKSKSWKVNSTGNILNKLNYLIRTICLCLLLPRESLRYLREKGKDWIIGDKISNQFHSPLKYFYFRYKSKSFDVNAHRHVLFVCVFWNPLTLIINGNFVSIHNQPLLYHTVPGDL